MTNQQPASTYVKISWILSELVSIEAPLEFASVPCWPSVMPQRWAKNTFHPECPSRAFQWSRGLQSNRGSHLALGRSGPSPKESSPTVCAASRHGFRPENDTLFIIFSIYANIAVKVIFHSPVAFQAQPVTQTSNKQSCTWRCGCTDSCRTNPGPLFLPLE